MLEITLLGNGGMMPLPNRFLTSMCLRYNGSSILVDCGEGTQIALRQHGLTAKPIDMMLITHFHGDHTIGIPGMLLLAANQGKTSPMTIVGPKGIKDIVKGLMVVSPHLPFEVKCIELKENMTIPFKELKIQAFRVEHSIECFGYSFELPRAGKFDVNKAMALNIDVRFWKKLQKGETVIVDGNKYLPSMVMGEARKGLKVTYVTDTRPVKSIVKHAQNSDLFICEGMYGDDGMMESAIEKKHMTFTEAATLAKEASVKELWLTHYSPSMSNPQAFSSNATNIFKNTCVCLHGNFECLMFED